MKYANKNANGWFVSETIKLSDTMVLDIITRKYKVFSRTIPSNIATVAYVSHLKDGYKTTALFQDFHKRYQTGNVKRLTEKSVKEFHNSFDINIAIADAKLHYGIE